MSESPNVHDAATIFSVLARPQVNALLSRLEIRDAQHLLATVAQNKPLSSAKIQFVADRLREAIAGLDPAFDQSFLLELPNGDDCSDFRFLIDATESQRRQILCECTDQEVGFVLMNLPDKHASACAKMISSERHLAVIQSLASDQSPNASAVDTLRRGIRIRIQELQLVTSKSDSDERKTLPPVAPESKSINSIAMLTDESIKQLLAKVNTSWWAPALQHASPETRQRVLSNVAAPVATILQQEIDSLVKLDHQAIRHATDKILAVAKNLERDPTQSNSDQDSRWKYAS